MVNRGARLIPFVLRYPLHVMRGLDLRIHCLAQRKISLDERKATFYTSM
jgi:hypothetical protein